MDSEIWAWSRVKMQLQHKQEIPYFYEREVWWTAIGRNIGFEEYGKGEYFARPVLVVRKFNDSFFIGLPISTTTRRGRYYHPLQVNGAINPALLPQIPAFEARRLLRKTESAPEEESAARQFKLPALTSPNIIPCL